MPDQHRVIEIKDGVYLWVEQGQSIHAKVVSPAGDPVELSADEARELAAALYELANSVDRV